MLISLNISLGNLLIGNERAPLTNVIEVLYWLTFCFANFRHSQWTARCFCIL